MYADGVLRSIRQLLETKHLYQSVSLSELESSLRTGMKEALVLPTGGGKTVHDEVDRIAQFIENAWVFTLEKGGLVVTNPHPRCFYWHLPHAKLNCEKCRREEAHKPDYFDVLPSGPPYLSSFSTQWFTWGYACQSCRETLVVFSFNVEAQKSHSLGAVP